MKTLFAFLTALCLVAATERPAQAASNVSVDVFYEALAPFGDWVKVEGYGYCFRPTASLKDASWRPYTEGSWVYSDAGWTWDSDEDFGWATFHYGRWFLLGGTWFWVPGEVWSPAWVSWRTGDEYIGWAPLPPEANWQPDVGFGIYVDIDYNIGPACYSFVPIHYLGERHLRHHVQPWQRNVECMRFTENRTRISHRSTGNRITAVFNDGPDFSLVSRKTEHPIRRLTLAEQESVDLRDRSAHIRNTADNDRLRVIAPTIERSGDREVAPKKVAHHFDRSKINRGWQGFREDEVRELRSKMETTAREANRDGKSGAIRESTTADRVPKALPRDAPVATRESDERIGTRTNTEALRKVEPATPGRDDGGRKRIDPGDAERLRKAIPVEPEDSKNEKTRVRPDENARKALPLDPSVTPEEKSRVRPDDQPGRGKGKTMPSGSITPGPDMRPLPPERLRVEPQDAPPRTQVGPKPGAVRPDENPPSPPRRINPDENSGNTQRPDRDHLPKVRPAPEKQIDNSPPHVTPVPRVEPNAPKITPPEARKIEPQKIEPPVQEPRSIELPKQEMPKVPHVETNRPTPPPTVNRPPPQPDRPANKPSGGGGSNRKSDEDEKKKPH